ncbi:MAG: DUF1926 domain-containing protein, partial [Candidatus Omnitrophica bacterium]|nr:DUF1926 domain-containing protein [Candidatus Omnitrophota bacterium]
MGKISFSMALHFHQPVGNFESVIERAHNLCYRPFLEALSGYPDIKMTFHMSGCLLDYFEQKQPDTISLIKKLTARGQIELMGGGYYEPILPAIPKTDALGQIRMMTEYVKDTFNFTPAGIWVAERVWEENLAKLIYTAGIRYCVLDDTHFLRSGLKKEDMHGYFLTGAGKEKIAVFPSDKTLRYNIPFKLPHETIDYFKAQADHRDNALFIYGDDGEKFGEWPGTHKWVFEELWLKRFFDTLCENRRWIELVHLSDYLENNKPNGTIDIKPGSYEEMMQWTGGSWMNFLKKYPETNQMHKKMFYVSEKIKNAAKTPGLKNSKELKAATKELYMGQCNCGYWHGVFGGLYLYHLRSAIYNHLITADKITDGLLHAREKKWLDIKQTDYDHDGEKEVIMENDALSLYIAPDEGGVLKELDYRPRAFNLINTLSRKKEPYHEKILRAAAKTNNNDIATIHDDFRTVDLVLKEKLSYDKFPRYALRNYFIKTSLSIDDFIKSSYEELGDFANSLYKTKVGKNTVTMERESCAFGAAVKIIKNIQIKSAKEIEIVYNLKGNPKTGLGAAFAAEFNFTMPYLNSERYAYFYDNKTRGSLNAKGVACGTDSFGIADSEKSFGLMLEF